MVVAWQGMAWIVNQMQLHNINQTGKIQSKPLMAQNGRGAA
jgi:hypothetical protein